MQATLLQILDCGCGVHPGACCSPAEWEGATKQGTAGKGRAERAEQGRAGRAGPGEAGPRTPDRDGDALQVGPPGGLQRSSGEQ